MKCVTVSKSKKFHQLNTRPCLIYLVRFGALPLGHRRANSLLSPVSAHTLIGFVSSRSGFRELARAILGNEKPGLGLGQATGCKIKHKKIWVGL